MEFNIQNVPLSEAHHPYVCTSHLTAFCVCYVLFVRYFGAGRLLALKPDKKMAALEKYRSEECCIAIGHLYCGCILVCDFLFMLLFFA